MRISPIYKELPPEELNQWMEEQKTFHLVGTSLSDRFRRIHIPNSTNACVFEVTFIAQFKDITSDYNAKIVLYGSSGRSMDAIVAAEKLQQEGYRRIYVLTGGIEAWHSVGFPLTGDAVDEPDDPQTFLKLKDRSFQIDSEQSSIEWRGRNPTSTHYGTVSILSGELQVKESIITGWFDIDMNSMSCINLEGDELQPVLIAHLQSDDFFHTRLFPKAEFEINNATPAKKAFLSSPNYLINGTLDLKGVKAKQDFMATITETAENGLAIEAHFDIDRTRWNIIYGSARFFEYLGMHLVFDLISFQLRIAAR